MADADFWFSFMPIALGHLAVPPLSVFEGREYPLADFFTLLYDLWPSDVLTYQRVLSWTMTSADRSHPILTSKHLSHLFVHANYDHLFGNLVSALQCSYAVYCELGSTEMHIVFFGGGVASAFPSVLRVGQNKQVAESLVGPAPSLTWLPGWLARPVQQGRNTLVGVVQSVISKTSYSCGSSGAVSALMGCKLALFVTDALITVSNEWTELSKFDQDMDHLLVSAASRPGNSTIVQRDADDQLGKWEATWMSRLGRRAWNSMRAVVYGRGFLWRALSAANVARLIYFDARYLMFAESPASFSNIDRAGHLQGALFGIAYGMLRAYVLIGRRSTSSNSNSSRAFI